MNLEKQINENRPYHILAPYNKMEEAYDFAKERHNRQTRKDGSAYINHPIKVSELVTAAYLHDTVEDTETTISEIEEKFGKYVAYLVEGVTSDETIKNKIGKTAYLCNKMLNMEEDILNLKLCDRLANVLDLNNADDEFIERYLTETTIILNYLLENRNLNTIQLEIIKEINERVNKLRKIKILKLINNNL